MQGKPKNLQFSDGVEELDAASSAVAGASRSVRGRVLTGFIKDGVGANQQEPRKNLQFTEVIEELDAASEAVDGPKRSVRARLLTGFVKDGQSGILKAGNIDTNNKLPEDY